MYRYSFAPNPEWSHRFSPGAEILDYFKGVAKKHDIESYVKFNTEITRARFEAGEWHLETRDETDGEADGEAGGQDLKVVDIVVSAAGVLHHPVYPDIKGVDDFAGAVFHSARWNHDVTLAGKRIGIIGTGSTAVQITAELVDKVAHLSLFQRTAQ
jgi:cation diffusion facilitator CzcD-associated flavoprotein CzcO